MSRKEAGRKGGLATLAKEGRAGMIRRAKAGFAATVAKHWQGDRAGYTAWLHRRSHEAQAEALADVLNQQRIDNGAAISSVEMAVLTEPGEGYWQQRVRGEPEGEVEIPF